MILDEKKLEHEWKQKWRPNYVVLGEGQMKKKMMGKNKFFIENIPYKFVFFIPKVYLKKFS